jgi:hypothetical protein
LKSEEIDAIQEICDGVVAKKETHIRHLPQFVKDMGLDSGISLNRLYEMGGEPMLEQYIVDIEKEIADEASQYIDPVEQY